LDCVSSVGDAWFKRASGPAKEPQPQPVKPVQHPGLEPAHRTGSCAQGVLAAAAKLCCLVGT